jgi:hypothetical protein
MVSREVAMTWPSALGTGTHERRRRVFAGATWQGHIRTPSPLRIAFACAGGINIDLAVCAAQYSDVGDDERACVRVRGGCEIGKREERGGTEAATQWERERERQR